jgi:hypothetical protein
MQTNDGHQKGPQDHAEGEHGEKTHNKIIEQLQSGGHPEPPKEPHHHGVVHRLTEPRRQHDQAEKRSEKTRLSREIDRGHVNGVPVDGKPPSRPRESP